MEFRTGYGPKVRVKIETPEKGAKQSFKRECDINTIMQKYQKSGVIQHAAKHEGRYGFAPSTSFGDALILMSQAREQFEDLPSQLRNHFGDVEAWLDFAVENGENTPEALQAILDEANGDEERVDAPGGPGKAPEGAAQPPEAAEAHTAT